MVVCHAGYANSSTEDLRAVRQPHIQVELLAAPKAASGQMQAGVLFQPDPGWHVYWLNPGDTGLAPVISWSGDAKFSSLQWPFPEAIPVAHLTNWGYHEETLITASYDQSGAQSAIGAELEWLVCKESCIPGSAKLSLDPAKLSEAELRRAEQYFAEFQTQVPKALGLLGASAKIIDGNLALEIYAAKKVFAGASSVQVFIENLDLVVYGEPVHQHAANNVLIWQQKLNEYFGGSPNEVRAVIVVNHSQAYALAIPFTN